MKLDGKAGAIFSPDRIYRYVLWRRWDDQLPAMNVIGLNPSTADETVDDPTIRRCIGFAKREGCGSMFMTNVFAYRSTNPHVLSDPYVFPSAVGPDNDGFIEKIAAHAQVVVAAWGAEPVAEDRARELRPVLHRARASWLLGVYCLGKTKSGAPRHPLYLSKLTPLEPYC
jgi:hypothetical protein